MLAVPLNVHALQALAEEPRPLVDLRRAMGSPPQTTMRGHLRALTEAGIVERRRQPEFPSSVDYELGRSGQELLGVAKVLQAWLFEAPDGPLLLGSIGARSAIKALVEGWSSAVVRALAAKPLALTELSRLITDLSYPSLERRLSGMRLAGQIEPCPGSGRSRPYRVTEWLRHAVAPLAAAARWERRHLAEQTAPIRRMDIEAAFLLAVPLVRLDEERSGTLRLAVELRSRGSEVRLVGMQARIRAGVAVSCVTRFEGQVDSWASGSASDWLEALGSSASRRLEFGGDPDLAAEVVDGLRGTFLPAGQRM